METGRSERGAASRRSAASAALLVLLACPGCWGRDSLPAEDPSRLTIQLRSPAFNNEGMIPKTITCDGDGSSPALEWSGVPDSTRSLALICDDPDAPMGTWAHWVLFNLPPRVKGLKGAVAPDGIVTASATETPDPTDGNAEVARQGKNDFGKIGYGGPCPPSGSHRYVFRLYALDTRLDLDSSAGRADVLGAIGGHILAEGRLVGQYQRAR